MTRLPSFYGFHRDFIVHLWIQVSFTGLELGLDESLLLTQRNERKQISHSVKKKIALENFQLFFSLSSPRAGGVLVRLDVHFPWIIGSNSSTVFSFFKGEIEDFTECNWVWTYSPDLLFLFTENHSNGFRRFPVSVPLLLHYTSRESFDCES